MYFDSTGHYLYTLGGVGRGPGEYVSFISRIELTKDSAVFIKSDTKWLEYALDGQLIEENLAREEDGKTFGAMFCRMNDSTILCDRDAIFGGPKTKAWTLQLISSEDFKERRSFFAAQSAGDLNIRNQLYMKDDTACFYGDMESCIYTVREDTLILRYRVDKGVYDRFNTNKEILEKGVSVPPGISIGWLSENSRYVIGQYLLERDYSFFIYDKYHCKTYNLQSQLEDDLLLGKIDRLYYHCGSSPRISDGYLYLYFSPSKFATLVEAVQKNLSDAEWEAYQQKHPDLMRVYRELNEDSNTVVVGYKFK